MLTGRRERNPYSDATRIRDAANAAGVSVAFESWRHGIHVWPAFISAGLSESAAAIERLATFFKVVIGIGTDRGLSA
jgi:hypothetical protein